MADTSEQNPTGTYRPWTGWIEHPLRDHAFVICQHGKGFSSPQEALKEARDNDSAWIEKDGQPAHISSHTRININK